MKLVVTLERDETGMIVVQCPAIPGCVSQGRTEEEAVKNIREAIQACVETRAARGMPVTVSLREVEVPV
jgi:predicted RNase H-like HicB family nuclease